jgi:hypothetical protein
MTDTKPTGLALLREPFPAHQISKLPKETKKQADDRKTAMAKGQWPDKCSICEGYHHPKAVHLDYVGHAALTDRLLDVDPSYSCLPMAHGPDGLPLFDRNGGLWVNLTVCGVTRMGYGDADGKTGGNAIKEAIGDAMRNAAMRFGAALDLWHKGDLHIDDGETEKPEAKTDAKPDKTQPISDEQRDELAVLIDSFQLDVMEVCTAMKIKSLKHIPAHKFEGARDFINKFAQEKSA